MRGCASCVMTDELLQSAWWADMATCTPALARHICAWAVPRRSPARSFLHPPSITSPSSPCDPFLLQLPALTVIPIPTPLLSCILVYLAL